MTATKTSQSDVSCELKSSNAVH